MDSAELDEAVQAGVITPEAARELRNFAARRSGAPLADEERLGAITLADVMTAIGMALLALPMLGLGFVLGGVGMFVGALLAWGLAEYFTRRRRLTLTSFVLFFTFLTSCAMGMLMVAALISPFEFGPGPSKLAPVIAPMLGLVVAGGSAILCAIWWARFQLPIAIAAVAVASINALVHVMHLLIPDAPTGLVSVTLLGAGLMLFLAAMWWDVSDVRRETRRADVGFWLHCAAGYQIAGASFRLILGVEGDPHGWDRLYAFTPQAPDGITTIAALLLFAVLVGVALVIDRRSLLLSSLVFVFPAVLRMLAVTGPAAPAGAMVMIGLLLVLVAAFWGRLRALLLPLVPRTMRAQLPRTALAYARARPVA